MKIIKQIAQLVTKFIMAIFNGVIEGRRRQAEYLARNCRQTHHYWD